jgi:hypothetical protein
MLMPLERLPELQIASNQSASVHYVKSGQTMKNLSLLILPALVTACATAANYERMLNSWIGASESEIVAKWGPPQATYNLADGGKVVTYIKSDSTVTIPGVQTTQAVTSYQSATFTGDLKGSYSGYTTTYVPTTTPSTTIRRYCRVDVLIQNGRGMSWRTQGNDCTATDDFANWGMRR